MRSLEERLDCIEKGILRIELGLDNHLKEHENEMNGFLKVKLPIFLIILQSGLGLLIYFLFKLPVLAG